MSIKYIKQSTVNRALRLHLKWLRNEKHGKRLTIGFAISLKINWSKINLSYADLRSANLSSANLSYADLRSANLSSANLSYADLSSANLGSANLRYANLSYANLSSANLSSANLSSANLGSANLRYANLSYANLRYANLSSANLSSANLSYADLSSANLSYADLSWASTINVRNLRVISCQLNTSDQNRNIAYYPDLNLITAGCFSGTLNELKERVKEVHEKDDPSIYAKYQAVFTFIETVLEIEKRRNNHERKQ